MTTMAAAPQRSLMQRMDALDRANEIRIYRAGVKRDLKAGRRRLADVIENPEPEVVRMGLLELLLATPKVGRVKANKTLGRVGIGPRKSVGQLSERQRNELLRLLR